MGMALKIRTILLERNMSIKELSEKLGYKGANLYNKLRRDNLTEKELREIISHKFVIKICPFIINLEEII